MIIRIVLLLTCALLFVSCGAQSFNGSKEVALAREAIITALDQQTFECASLNGGSCPSGLARLIIFNSKKSGKSSLCSGFLNGSNKIVTNNHCVATEAQCQNTFISIYNGSSYENVRCKKILESKIDPGVLNQKGVDFTVLEIDRRVDIHTLPLALHRPYVGESLTAWVVDHVSLTEVRMTEINCNLKTKSNSLMASHCPVIQGNSGSPILNSFGEVVGVIWGSTAGVELQASTPLTERRLINEYALITELKHFQTYLSSK